MIRALAVFAALAFAWLVTDVPSSQRPAPPVRTLNARDAGPGFTGSKHDFYGPMAPLAQRCAPCHAQPRPASVTFLWDPPFERGERLESAQPEQRIADSTALCLSCHDGTIASEIVGGGDDASFFASDAHVNPRRDHPVGVPYPPRGRAADRLRREYVPIAKLQSEGVIRLPAGRVECVSCHDPHNALGVGDMLVKSDRRSALCLSCHVK
ncbi:MAG: cytochrome c3 family protein [Phycisphaerae bacterium]|nr:cytochrome c3 family protein [Phycisphaerae bacterium]